MDDTSMVAPRSAVDVGFDHPVTGRAVGLRAWFATHPIEAVALAVGLGLRLIFWALTQRQFEDALITVTHARNAVDGYGLTSHPYEPATHGFTSALGVLVPLIGELLRWLPAMDGLVFLRLTSLAAFVATIVAASRLLDQLRVQLAGRILALGYLAVDFQHIYFAMAGMETQVAVAVLLWAIVVGVERRPGASGVLYGACLLARPDFLLFVGPALLWWAFRDRANAIKVAASTAAVVAPWVLFTLWYYGSVVPNTIGAKALRFQPTGVPHNLSLGDWWAFGADLVLPRVPSVLRMLSPFWDDQMVLGAPALQGIGGLLLVLAAFGLTAARRVPGWAPAVAFATLFLAYRVTLLPVGYYDWYYPPLTAVIVLGAAAGLDRLVRRPAVVAGVAAAVICSFVVALPAELVLEVRYQHAIEDRVRRPLGLWLGHHAAPGSTVTSESAGYISYYAAPTVKLWDYPGLTSRQAYTMLRTLGAERNQLGWLIHAARPDYLVLRPNELVMLEQEFPSTAALYERVARFAVRNPGLRWGGVEYVDVDREFLVLRRMRGSEGGIVRARMLAEVRSADHAPTADAGAVKGRG
jgi:hypothetical protein